ncbi:MAG: oligosaccharide repeat unit polymerase [Prevotella sp.]|nr:oligosaccharide repeat unit polymerase [Prevotella sp.]
MSALYAFTSLCSALIVAGGLLDDAGILFDEYNVELGIVPTALYCLLITMGLLPFSLIYNKNIEKKVHETNFGVDCFCWLLFFVFLINVYLIYSSTTEILSSDLAAVRMDHYEGYDTPASIKARSLPTVLKYVMYLRSSTIVALPLFFYYTCFTNKAWWFKAALLLASLTQPIYGIQVADRTEFTFYALMFAFCLIFFWRNLSKLFKRGLLAAGIPFAMVVLIYLAAVSQARFAGNKEDDEKVYEAALQYAGQNYLNFCYFWEKANFEYLAPEREFPFTYHTLYGIDSNPERRSDRSGQQGFFMSVFAAYVGDVMLDLSPIGAIIWCTVFFLLALAIIRYSHRKVFDAGDVVAIFTLAAIPIFGIFYYRYYSYDSFFMFLSVLTIYLLSKIKIVYE